MEDELLEYCILGDDVAEFRFDLGVDHRTEKTKHVQVEVQQGLMSKLRSKLTSNKDIPKRSPTRTRVEGETRSLMSEQTVCLFC